MRQEQGFCSIFASTAKPWWEMLYTSGDKEHNQAPSLIKWLQPNVIIKRTQATSPLFFPFWIAQSDCHFTCFCRKGKQAASPQPRQENDVLNISLEGNSCLTPTFYYCFWSREEAEYSLLCHIKLILEFSRFLSQRRNKAIYMVYLGISSPKFSHL